MANILENNMTVVTIAEKLDVIDFDFIEYSVFGLMLGLSTLIGIYFGFIKGGQDTVDGYLLGGKQMGLFPISMSLVSGHVSGITMLGMPAEIYTYGTQYMTMILSVGIVGIVCAYVFLPVFYELQVISVYEYMELRFNKTVRKMVSIFFAVNLFVHMPIVIYGPALALNHVSGLNVLGTAFVLCVICIFYTAVGGLKAVVWTDTLQGVIMVISTSVVAVIGTIKVGGVSALIQAAEEGDRLEIFNMDPDPRLRLTFWTAIIGFTIAGIASSPINPSVVQRFVSLNTIKKARWSVFYFIIGCSFLYMMSCYMGLIIYAQYKSCDPKTLGLIKSNDQILPYFIIDVAGKYRGLPGLFLAGVVSAALSTMSAGMNTVAGTLYEDIIEPIIGKTTEAKASRNMKILATVFGILTLLMVLVIEKLGSLLELSYAFAGLSSGSILGIFVLGMVFPQATSKGAIVGGVTGILTLTGIFSASRVAVVHGDLVYPVKPVSVEGCAFNISNIDIKYPPPPVTGEIFPLFEVSTFYYVAMGCTITILVGLLVSFASGPNKVEDVKRTLLTPVIHRFLPTYKPVPVNGVELHQVKS